MLTRIVDQGVQEGIFKAACLDQVGEVVLSLLQGMGDAMANSMFIRNATFDYPRITGTIDAFTRALERVLGAPEDSLHLLNDEVLKEWVVLIQNTDESVR